MNWVWWELQPPPSPHTHKHTRAHAGFRNSSSCCTHIENYECLNACMACLMIRKGCEKIPLKTTFTPFSLRRNTQAAPNVCQQLKAAAAAHLLLLSSPFWSRDVDNPDTFTSVAQRIIMCLPLLRLLFFSGWVTSAWWDMRAPTTPAALSFQSALTCKHTLLVLDHACPFGAARPVSLFYKRARDVREAEQPIRGQETASADMAWLELTDSWKAPAALWNTLVS